MADREKTLTNIGYFLILLAWIASVSFVKWYETLSSVLFFVFIFAAIIVGHYSKNKILRLVAVCNFVLPMIFGIVAFMFLSN